MASLRPSQQVAAQSLLKDKQRYVKGYLQVVQNLYSRGAFTQQQARLADLAYQRRLPPSAFVTLLRKHDPQYAKTKEFGLRQADARETWSRTRPGRPMPQEFAAKYVHSSLNKQQLLERVERAANAQRTKSLFKPSQSPQAYAQMRAMLNDSFRRLTGKDASPLLHDLVFSTKMQEQHIDERYHELFGGKEVFKWMDPQEADRSLQKALTVPSSDRVLTSAPPVFLGNTQNQFGIGVEDMSASLIDSGQR